MSATHVEADLHPWLARRRPALLAQQVPIVEALAELARAGAQPDAPVTGGATLTLLRDARAGRVWRDLGALLSAEMTESLSEKERRRLTHLQTGVNRLIRAPLHALDVGGRGASGPVGSPWAGLWLEARAPYTPWLSDGWRWLLLSSPVVADHARAASYWQSQLGATTPRARSLGGAALGGAAALAWWRTPDPVTGQRPLDQWQQLSPPLQAVWAKSPMDPGAGPLLVQTLRGAGYSRRQLERLRALWPDPAVAAAGGTRRPVTVPRDDQACGPALLLVAFAAGLSPQRVQRFTRRLLLSPVPAIRLAAIQAMGQGRGGATPAGPDVPEADPTTRASRAVGR